MSKQELSSRKSQSQALNQESFRQPEFDYIDMPTEMQETVIEICEDSLRLLSKGDKKYYFECAEVIKKGLETKLGGCWNVVVGRGFGCYFNYEAGHCLQFWVNQHCFLVYKHG